MSLYALNNSAEKIKVKNSRMADIGIGTGSDQWNRKKRSKKTSPIGKVKDRRDTNTAIN